SVGSEIEFTCATTASGSGAPTTGRFNPSYEAKPVRDNVGGVLVVGAEKFETGRRIPIQSRTGRKTPAFTNCQRTSSIRLLISIIFALTKRWIRNSRHAQVCGTLGSTPRNWPKAVRGSSPRISRRVYLSNTGHHPASYSLSWRRFVNQNLHPR